MKITRKNLFHLGHAAARWLAEHPDHPNASDVETALLAFEELEALRHARWEGLTELREQP